MRVVADTNVVVSGMLWNGPSRKVLDAARNRDIELFSDANLLAELTDVLGRGHLQPRIAAAGTDPSRLIEGFGQLATMVEHAATRPAVSRDPDDDVDLLCLKRYESIAIMTATDLVRTLGG